MKTLDEVIDDLTECHTNWARWSENSDIVDRSAVDDALHYLQEYRSEKAMWEADRKGYLDWIEQYKEAREKHQQAVIELKKNPPLTWEELREMRVQPVWFEVLDHQSLPLLDCWTITTGIPYKSWQGVESMAFIRPGASYSVPVADYGKTWITYRKERKCTNR